MLASESSNPTNCRAVTLHSRCTASHPEFVSFARPVDELLARWQERRKTFATFGASIDGVKLANPVLADLAALDSTVATVTPADAAQMSGYHAESIGRLIRQGKLTN